MCDISSITPLFRKEGDAVSIEQNQDVIFSNLANFENKESYLFKSQSLVQNQVDYDYDIWILKQCELREERRAKEFISVHRQWKLPEPPYYLQRTRGLVTNVNATVANRRYQSVA